jgi:hypothetical protein
VNKNCWKWGSFGNQFVELHLIELPERLETRICPRSNQSMAKSSLETRDPDSQARAPGFFFLHHLV